MPFFSFLLAVSQPVVVSTAARHSIGIADAPAIPWVRIVLALLFCLALSVAAILLLRRFGRGGGGAPALLAGLKGVAGSAEIEIIETRRASVHGHICLFHCRGSAYLVSITTGGATLIDKMPVPPALGSEE